MMAHASFAPASSCATSAASASRRATLSSSVFGRAAAMLKAARRGAWVRGLGPDKPQWTGAARRAAPPHPTRTGRKQSGSYAGHAPSAFGYSVRSAMSFAATPLTSQASATQSPARILRRGARACAQATRCRRLRAALQGTRRAGPLVPPPPAAPRGHLFRSTMLGSSASSWARPALTSAAARPAFFAAARMSSSSRRLRRCARCGAVRCGARCAGRGAAGLRTPCDRHACAAARRPGARWHTAARPSAGAQTSPRRPAAPAHTP